MSDRVEFVCNGDPVAVDAETGETLLNVLRERLGLTSAKDGCAPQGQCGCCTVLVDGDARVACVTPVARIAGRSVTTLEGIDPTVGEQLAEAFVATGGSQCGFCTPGIVVRAAASRAKGKTARPDLDRALAAHLCRCTGWQTVYDALDGPAAADRSRDLDAAATRAGLEGGNHQAVAPAVPLGHGGFADDTAPRDALVAVPLPPRSDAPFVEAAGIRWVVGESLAEVRTQAGKVQGRRSTVEVRPPLALPPLPDGGVRLATSWVEPAYLEPDASWCAPGGDPASPLGNGGAFGGKVDSPVAPAARELADRYGRTVRTLFSREDVVRLGPKRPPIAASCVLRDGELLVIEGRSLADLPASSVTAPFELDIRWEVEQSSGPVGSSALRAT
ncbi:MAG: 2Fe-2S iron-sulfur cluster-binding protein, partial [Acidimicrobiia bacterium]